MRRPRSPTAGLLLAGPLLAAVLSSRADALGEGELPAALERALSAAEGSLRAGDRKAAEGRYHEAFFHGWLLIGALERIDKRWPAARVAVRRASLFAGEDPLASRSLALAYLQAGEPAEAVASLSARAARVPTDVHTRRLLAVALHASGRREQAISMLDEAAAAAGGDPALAFQFGSQYLSLKRVDVAERLFAKVVAERPIPQTHVLIGRAYRDAGEFARARRELQQALRMDPSVRRAHYYLGMITLSEGGNDAGVIETAKAEFRQELKIAPADPLASHQLGLALLDSGGAAQALPLLEAAVRGEARSLHLGHLGRCQLALDRPADAVASLRRALELASDQGASDEEVESIHYQLGRALRSLGSEAEAKSELAEAGRIAARRRESTAGAPAVELSSLLGPSPLAALAPAPRRELARRTRSSLARAYFNLGVMAAQASAPAAERFARAAASFERAAELDPDFPQLQASLGVARFNARQFAAAVEPLALAVAANPANADLKRMLAAARVDTQAWDEAARLLNDDPQLANEPALRSARALALLRSGRAAEAEPILAELASQDASPEIQTLLGEARAALGRSLEGAGPHKQRGSKQ